MDELAGARAMAALAIMTLAATSAPADDRRPCPLSGGGHGVVVAVPDGETVVLEDGSTIRLVNALAPRRSSAGRIGEDALAEQARQWLEAAVLGRAVRYAFGGRRADRHGRLLAQLFLDDADALWLQAALVESGLARAYSHSDNRACAAPLLAREAAARAARRGIWAEPSVKILPAEPPDRVVEEVGRFAIVEGRVLSVGERRLRTYLNFGTYWNVDFTVIVAGRDRDTFVDSGVELGSLAGQVVRVRGWVLDDRGPAIAVTHPEQIEIVGID